MEKRKPHNPRSFSDPQVGESLCGVQDITIHGETLLSYGSAQEDTPSVNSELVTGSIKTTIISQKVSGAAEVGAKLPDTPRKVKQDEQDAVASPGVRPPPTLGIMTPGAAGSKAKQPNALDQDEQVAPGDRPPPTLDTVTPGAAGSGAKQPNALVQGEQGGQGTGLTSPAVRPPPTLDTATSGTARRGAKQPNALDQDEQDIDLATHDGLPPNLDQESGEPHQKDPSSPHASATPPSIKRKEISKQGRPICKSMKKN